MALNRNISPELKIKLLDEMKRAGRKIHSGEMEGDWDTVCIETMTGFDTPEQAFQVALDVIMDCMEMIGEIKGTSAIGALVSYNKALHTADRMMKIIGDKDPDDPKEVAAALVQAIIEEQTNARNHS